MALLQHHYKAQAEASSNVTSLAGHHSDDNNLDWNHSRNAYFIIYFIFDYILCLDYSVNSTHITQHTPENTTTRRRTEGQPETSKTLKSDENYETGKNNA